MLFVALHLAQYTQMQRLGVDCNVIEAERVTAGVAAVCTWSC